MVEKSRKKGIFGRSMRRDLKRESRKNLRRNFFMNILVIFIVSVVINGYHLASRDQTLPEIDAVQEIQTIGESELKAGGSGSVIDSGVSNFQIFQSLMLNLFGVPEIKNADEISSTSAKYYGGVASVFFNEITGSQSFIFGIINGLNTLIFKGRISSSIMIFIFSAISIVLFIFVKNVITVGKNRYYLEQRRYTETSPMQILYPYRNKRLWNIARVMFIRYIFQILWDLTIVGGVIKRYEYRMIPYILAENPEIYWKDAFKISKELTQGEKWQLFINDVTIYPWSILSYITFGISAMLYSNAYIECLNAEIYMGLRGEKKKGLLPELRLALTDDMLQVPDVMQRAYPSSEENYGIHMPSIYSLKRDYNRSYNFQSIVQLFFSYSFVGWAWEVVFYMMSTGKFVNRGTMLGPWLPIYGVGGILIMLLLKRFRDRPWLLFFLTMALCGSVEYFTSWILEVLFDKKWWDYTGYFMNLNGRICLEGLFVFGLAGVAFTYIISPWLDDMFEKINLRFRKIVFTVLLIVFAADVAWSAFHPNTGDGVTDGLVRNDIYIEKQAEI